MHPERPVAASESGHQVAQRVGDRSEEYLRHADWQGHPEGIAQPTGVLDAAQRSCPPMRTADDPPADSSSTSHAPTTRASEVAASDEIVDPQRPRDPDQVGEVLGVAGGPLGDQPLQLGLGRGHGRRVEQVTQRQAVARAEQLGQQRGVEGERCGPALGQR
jgi:hypothetical protein